MPLKITMLGAGSIGFTRRLMQGILAVPELHDAVFSLMDIKARSRKEMSGDRAAARANAGLADKGNMARSA